MATQTEIATQLGLTKGRVSQLVKEGMPTDTVESARAWRARRKGEMEAAGHISQPVRPLNLSDLDSLLREVGGGTGAGGETTEMDTRIKQQVDLCEMTRQVFMQALEAGDPAQGKLYANYDRAIATLLRLEKERQVRLIEESRLIDASEAAARFGKILGQLRSNIERAELTVAPRANPDNPPKALKAFREFRDDLFRKISEYNVEVTDGSPRIGEDEVGAGEGETEPTLGDAGVGALVKGVMGESAEGEADDPYAPEYADEEELDGEMREDGKK